MADITITDANPTIIKATGGGGRASSVLTDANPTEITLHGGGRSSPILIDRNPIYHFPKGFSQAQIIN